MPETGKHRSFLSSPDPGSGERRQKPPGTTQGINIEELQRVNEELLQARRAALNLMEDTILSKEAFQRSEERYRLKLEQEVQDRTTEILDLKDEIARKATDRYLTLFNNMEQGFCIIEVIFDNNETAVDYRFLEINPVFENQTGLHGATGRTMRELQPDHEEHWFKIYGEIAKTGRPAHFESEAANPAGRVWFDVYAFPFGAAENCQVAVLFNDITTRKHHERKQQFLLKLSDTLRAIVDPVEVQENVMQATMNFFKADRCYYCEIEGDRSVIHRDARRPDLASVAGSYSLDSIPVYKAVIHEGHPLVVPDMTTSWQVDESLRQLYIQLNAISFVDIPVIKNGLPVGIFCLVQTVPRNWTRLEVELAEEVAERTWQAVQRVNAEQALRESEMQKAFLLKLSDTLRSLSDSREIQKAASRFVGEHLQADRVLYAEIEGSGQSAEAVIRGQFVQNGAPVVPERISYAAVSQGLLAESFREGIPFVVNDVVTDPRFDDAMRAVWLSIGGRSAISLSLIKNGTEKVIFSLHDSEPRAWTKTEIDLVVGVAERTWAAAERARAEEALQKLNEHLEQLVEARTRELIKLKVSQEKEKLNAVVFTQEQERARISEGLHDGVAQLLYAVQNKLQELSSDRSEDQESLEVANDILSDAILDLRQIAFELMPVMLKDYGLEASLNTLLKRIVPARPALKLGLEVNFKGRFPDRIEITLYRIVQEIVNNILKHSHATQASIRLYLSRNYVCLMAADNGKGFSPRTKKSRHKGIGLQSIRNRVKLLDGKIKISSQPGQGTTIKLQLPLKEI
jgi:signal transduction histidine kinase/PAS domain-containing protein